MFKNVLSEAVSILGDGEITEEKKRNCLTYCKRQQNKNYISAMFLVLFYIALIYISEWLMLPIIMPIIKVVTILLLSYVLLVRIPMFFLFMSGLNNTPVNDAEQKTK